MGSKRIYSKTNKIIKSKLVNIFNIALDDLTGLISPRKIIYCEGRDRPSASGNERGFDAIIYNSIFGEIYNDTIFISSGGNTELDQRSDIAIKILNKAINDLEIYVLKDLDMISSRSAKLDDRKQYLQNNPDNHRLLKRREIENYLFDKEVLVQYCIAYGYTFDEEFYDSFVSDINIENVKDELGKIKKACGIDTSINAEKFKMNLANYIVPEMNVFKELAECIFTDII